MKIDTLEILVTSHGSVRKGMITSFGGTDCIVVSIMREVLEGSVRHVAFLQHSSGVYKVDPDKQHLPKLNEASVDLYAVYPQIEAQMNHRKSLPDNFTMELTAENSLEVMKTAMKNGYEIVLPSDIMDIVYMTGTSVEEFVLRSLHDPDIMEDIKVQVMSIGGSPQMIVVQDVDIELDLNLDKITEGDFCHKQEEV